MVMKTIADIPGKVVQINSQNGLFSVLTDEGKIYQHISYFIIGDEKVFEAEVGDERDSAEHRLEWMNLDDMLDITRYSKAYVEKVKEEIENEKKAKEAEVTEQTVEVIAPVIDPNIST